MVHFSIFLFLDNILLQDFCHVFFLITSVSRRIFYDFIWLIWEIVLWHVFFTIFHLSLIILYLFQTALHNRMPIYETRPVMDGLTIDRIFTKNTYLFNNVFNCRFRLVLPQAFQNF